MERKSAGLGRGLTHRDPTDIGLVRGDLDVVRTGHDLYLAFGESPSDARQIAKDVGSFHDVARQVIATKRNVAYWTTHRSSFPPTASSLTAASGSEDEALFVGLLQVEDA